jgi:TonB-dependent starch-binding outer membrane protein SusC
MQKMRIFCKGIACCTLPHFNWYQFMRVSTVMFMAIIFLTNLLIASPGRGQESEKETISLRLSNASLLKVIKAINAQSNFVIMYELTPKIKNVKVTIAFINKTIDEVMDELVKGRNLQWSRQKNVIILEDASDTTAIPSGALKYPAIIPSLTQPPVSGIVRGPDAQPLAGVNIIVKGTNRGTTSRADGTFSIAANAGETLQISSVGYNEKLVLIRNDSFIGIVALALSDSKLDEVQIIAYGETSRRLQTGNVGTVKAEEIAKQPVNNPLLALQGRVPGVMIEQASGFSGAGVKVRIQGQNSISRGNDPFYVIDGVPYVSQLLPNLGVILGGFGAANGNPLAFINPADIESIDVLKDADATAIYGSRASNGAILITTKKGKAGTMHVSLNFQAGYGQVTRRLKLLSTSQYIEMRKETKMNDNEAIGDDDYDINGTWSEHTNHDWQKELLGGKAKYNDLQASLSGGNSNVQYLIGTGFHKESTVFPTDLADTKVNVRFNMNAFSNDRRFSATFSGSFLNDDNRLPNVDLTRNAMTLSPNAPDLRKADGSLNWGVNDKGFSTIGINHPLAKITALYKSNTNNLLANASFNYYITKALNFKTTFGYNALSSDELITGPASIWAPEYSSFVTRSASYGDNRIKTWIIEPQLNFEHHFLNGKIKALLGSSLQQMTSNRKVVNGSGYISDLVLENIGAATHVTVPPSSTIASKYKYNAGFFSINYNLDDKYILNVSGRRDGSSRYGSANRFHNFGAVGAAWLFSNEKFFNPLSKIIDFGKLRVSYGTTGSDQIGDYVYLSLYSYNTPPIPYRGAASLIQNKLTNPYIQWEETRKFSLGLDLGFFSDRILINCNYFLNSSSNLIYFGELPSTAGPRMLDVNLPAEVQNSGVEVQISTINISKKNYKWSSSFNITAARNMLRKFDNLSTSSFFNEFVVGRAINIVKTYPFKGVDSEEGRYLYADKNGNLTDDPNSDPANKTVIFNRDPKFFGGLNNTISYKGLQLDFLLQFVKQVASGYAPDPPGFTAVNQPESVFERWQKVGDKTNVQKFSKTDPMTVAAYFNKRESDAFYIDGSYMRLKNASLSWTLPLAVRKKLSLENGRVFINCQNLFTITSYRGLDPETQSSVSLPPLRVFAAGFQLTF